jgi:transcriptional regulator with XRE-family HTH domain
MKKINYKKIKEDLNVSHSAVSQWFSGKTQPTIDKVIRMNEIHKIPFTAWKDIKSYVTESVTSLKQ